jgi:hypothetical protein
MNQFLNRSDFSAFDPYILKTLHESKVASGSPVSKAVLGQFDQLESYIVRHNICGVSTKDFPAECLSLVRGEKTLEDLWLAKEDQLDNSAVELATSKLYRTIDGKEMEVNQARKDEQDQFASFISALRFGT